MGRDLFTFFFFRGFAESNELFGVDEPSDPPAEPPPTGLFLVTFKNMCHRQIFVVLEIVQQPQMLDAVPQGTVPSPRGEPLHLLLERVLVRVVEAMNPREHLWLSPGIGFPSPLSLDLQQLLLGPSEFGRL
jgi:hypothetical protein